MTTSTNNNIINWLKTLTYKEYKISGKIMEVNIRLYKNLPLFPKSVDAKSSW